MIHLLNFITLSTIEATQAVAELNVESLISDLAFILILGAVTTLFFKWIKQPVVLGYIVAGFLASPHFVYLPSVANENNIEFWAQLGIVILLFSLGLEFSFKKLLNAGGSAVVTALIIVIGMMCAGFCIGRLLHFSSINSLFLGGMLSMSSTTIIIKAFNDLGITHKKFASQVFAVLIVEDLFAVLMMVILSSIAINNSVQGSDMLFSVSKLIFFLVIWFAIGVFLLPTFLNKVRQFLNTETLLIVSMGLCLGMAVFSVYCGFSLALGAFVMGSILAGTSFAERIEHVVLPVKDLFGSVFFISVGMMVNPDIIVRYAGPILLLSVVVIVGMILFGTFGMLVSGQTLKVAIESGFSLTQIGEFAFIIATLGMQLGVLDSSIYPIVVAVSVLTTFTTPYFIRMADPAYRIVERHLPQKLHFLIERYSKEAGSESETGKVWKALLKRYVWRVMLYASVLTSICLASTKWLLPWLCEITPNYGRLATIAIALLAMSPFLLAMSIPSSRKEERHALKTANSLFDVPLVVLTFFKMLIAIGFVVYIISAIYHTRIGIAVGVAVFLLIVIVLSKRTARRMHSIEDRFLRNLNERENRRSGRNNNIISNLHLAFMNVGYACPFVGQKLAESGLRGKYGVSVASIQRGQQTIAVPSGDTRIFPGDSLGVIGTEDRIQALLPIVEAQPTDTTSGVNAHDMRLTSIAITDHSPLAGLTVAESQLSTHYGSLLVSVMRHGKYFTPVGNTTFENGDVLWLVGDPAVLSPLKQKSL